MDSLSLVDKIFVVQWKDPALNTLILGKYPFKSKKYVGDGPYGHVYAFPPEQILSRLGVPLISSRGDTNTRPSVLTCHPHLNKDVGKPVIEEAVTNGTGNLIGWGCRNPLRVLDFNDPRMYCFGMPKYDDEGIGRQSAHNLVGCLGSDRFIERLTRSSMADPNLVEPAHKEQASSSWKEGKFTAGGIDEPKHEFERRMKRLGLSEGMNVTEKDRAVYMQHFIKGMCTRASLAKLVKIELVEAASSTRHPFAFVLMKSIGMAENDPNLTAPSKIGRRTKDDKTARYNMLQNKAELAEMDRVLFDDLGGGKAVEKAPGRYACAHSYETWGGVFGIWRALNYEDSKAMSNQRGKYRVGFRAATDNWSDWALHSKDFWRNNDVMPTKFLVRKSEPFDDRLFRTYGSRVATMEYLSRDADIIYVGKMASNPSTFHLNLSKADNEEYIMVKRVLSDTTILSLIEADTDWDVKFHSRTMELRYNVTVASHSQTVLYKALIEHSGLNVLRSVRNIFLELPHAGPVEVKCPFLYEEYRNWKSRRNHAGDLSGIEIRDLDGVVSAELALARLDFDKTCTTQLDSSVHRYNFFIRHACVYSRAHHSPSEDVEYLVESAEFMCIFVCFWWVVVRDAHIGEIEGDVTELGIYSPLMQHCTTAGSGCETSGDEADFFSVGKQAARAAGDNSSDDLESCSGSKDH